MSSSFARRSEFEIHLASHWGMCFGVRDAIALAEQKAEGGKLTILGEIVHNEVVRKNMRAAGAKEGDLGDLKAETPDVLITAHGASHREKLRWTNLGYRVQDATCPLVKKAHTALARLVAEGCFPVVIGKKGHAEVEGLMGDYPGAKAVLAEDEIRKLPSRDKFGIVSQTTQPIEFVRSLIAAFERHHPNSEIIFRDTVCQPTKSRQKALNDLAHRVDFLIVVGGPNSNNSRQLVEKARQLGCRAKRISAAEEFDPQWIKGVDSVGVTAGTSTLPSCVERLIKHLEALGGERMAS
ncbi:MAG: 4-hydroxy-3-methylbut-2-enyl diphosphate reductase [Akkermansiaceae bacterium]